jgi:DNA-directed RNA polymerase subunit RPC12/RpoP
MSFYECQGCRRTFYAGAATPAARCPSCRRRLVPIAKPLDAQPLHAPSVVSAQPGSYRAGSGTEDSFAAFIAADSRRLHSRERDFGLHWSEPGSHRMFRAAWIEATGELYLVQLGDAGDGGGHVELLAVFEGPALEAALHGSLRWLRRRSGGIPAPSAVP